MEVTSPLDKYLDTASIIARAQCGDAHAAITGPEPHVHIWHPRVAYDNEEATNRALTFSLETWVQLVQAAGEALQSADNGGATMTPVEFATNVFGQLFANAQTNEHVRFIADQCTAALFAAAEVATRRVADTDRIDCDCEQESDAASTGQTSRAEREAERARELAPRSGALEPEETTDGPHRKG